MSADPDLRAEAELRPQPAPAPRRRRLRVIGRQPLEAAFEAALARSLRQHAPGLNERQRDAIREQAFRDFMLLVGRKVRSVNGVSKRDFLAELERSHADALREREAVRAELERLQLRAAALRRSARDASELAAEDQQRSLTHYDRQIEVFERRIAKLNSSLESSEATIRELAAGKAVDPGVASIYRTVQGLADDEDNREAKHQLLVKLFEANLALRERTGASSASS